MTNKTNEIRDLLDGVAMTGTLPSDAEIRESVSVFSSVAQRREIERSVRIAAKKIIGALDANLPAQAREHAEEVGESLAEFTSAGPADVHDEPWPGETRRQHAPEPPRRDRAAEPLRSLLRGSTHARITDDELDRLSLREDLTDDERTAWRTSVRDAGADVRRAFASGAQADARAMADDFAARLGGAMVEPEHVDPTGGSVDPRELARAVPRGPR